MENSSNCAANRNGFFAKGIDGRIDDSQCRLESARPVQGDAVPPGRRRQGDTP